ncbi:outer membrane protein assembly factor BamE [Sulfitobacter sp. SK012]|uniref:outer membrane protein assembly factor BamE n=1 Tax=Sulfitobacter sp. SK012 TaxID=1389005 RepID=UPI000E0C36B6|nr:outer membrane protein assembly factor BamE [Sulfitobacter sp. SK012]AXI46217.1 outer membrane protein assembly factor BamE [Sulfitobacter sp. SK012]
MGREYSTIRRVTVTLAALVVVGALSACSPRFQNHGYIPEPEELELIVVGVDTRSSVEETVGVPTSAGILNDSGYYFVRSRMRSVAFLEPKVIEREVLAISFDTNGVVANVERFGLERGQVVPLARRVTDSGVTNTGFLRQLLGNFGQVDPAGAIGGL